MSTETVSPARKAAGFNAMSAARLLQKYAVAVMVLALMVALTILSDSFLTVQNLMNILNQNAPLAIMAAAMTLVIIGGGFDLSVGAIFAVASVSAAWVALTVDPFLGLAIAPLVGLLLGLVNGVTITYLNIHSFLATLATSLVFRGMAILITGGTLIPVRLPEFTWLGRGRIGAVYDRLCRGADGAAQPHHLRPQDLCRRRQ
jgi:ribose transport system permease protein